MNVERSLIDPGSHHRPRRVEPVDFVSTPIPLLAYCPQSSMP